MKYPETPRHPVVENIHGTSLTDNYQWLENVKAPEVRAWMDAQDALARGYLSDLPAKEKIANRLKEILYYDGLFAPSVRGERLFYMRRLKDKEKAILYWRENEKAPEKVLLDPNSWTKDGSSALGSYSLDRTGKLISYSVRPNNSDEAFVETMEVDTGKIRVGDRIEGAKYGMPNWLPDSSGFYYVFLPPAGTTPVHERPGLAEVRFHKMGTSQKEDTLVHPALGDPQKFIGTWCTRDGKWLFVFKYYGWVGSEAVFRPQNDPSAPWTTLFSHAGAIAHPTYDGRYFYLTSNEGAPNGQVFKVDPERPERKNWKLIVPERKDAVVEYTDALGGKLGLRVLRNARAVNEIRDVEGQLLTTLEPEALATSSSLSGEEGNPVAYFSVDSYTRPTTVFKVSLENFKTDVWAQNELKIDPTHVVVEQVWYPSKDGTNISMYIVRDRKTPLDGSAPLWLNGYGGFTVSMEPNFRASLYPWMEAGGIYAVPNLRGGGEYGEDWHRAGMLDKKQNVFDDMIAAAEFLIANKYTRAEKLAVSGGSNGGLLMGAMMTQRPELFRAVWCAVPLLDMLRYHLFGSGRTWIAEYGTAERAEDFRWIHAYSPYHHVKSDGPSYPGIVFATSDTDDRVDPLHARKMAALVQEKQGARARGPILLRIEKNAGHGGGDQVQKTIDEVSDQLAFFLRELGN